MRHICFWLAACWPKYAKTRTIEWRSLKRKQELKVPQFLEVSDNVLFGPVQDLTSSVKHHRCAIQTFTPQLDPLHCWSTRKSTPKIFTKQPKIIARIFIRRQGVEYICQVKINPVVIYYTKLAFYRTLMPSGWGIGSFEADKFRYSRVIIYLLEIWVETLGRVFTF